MILECKSCGELNPHRLHSRTKRPLDKCRACESAINKAKIKHRRQIVARYKQAKGCASCGIKDHRVLDLDHRYPSEKCFNVGEGIPSKGWATVKTEIMKCDVLCANCHRIKTFENKDRQFRREP